MPISDSGQTARHWRDDRRRRRAHRHIPTSGRCRTATLVARHLLDASTLCAIATVSPDNRPHINTAYFPWGDSWDLVWVSEPAAQHAQNVCANGLVAIAVYNSQQVWGNSDRGIQLFGHTRELEGLAARNAQALYTRRFAQFTQADLSAHHVYRCRPQRVKLFDERAFGVGAFVIARARRDGQLAWERTHLYRATT
jgi:uncharacterized protein YhbP (UPF0306 family)